MAMRGGPKRVWYNISYYGNGLGALLLPRLHERVYLVPTIIRIYVDVRSYYVHDSYLKIFIDWGRY